MNTSSCLVFTISIQHNPRCILQLASLSGSTVLDRNDWKTCFLWAFLDGENLSQMVFRRSSMCPVAGTFFTLPYLIVIDQNGI
jgi:hypothetical protein